jgi:hypothetical protein
MAQAGILAATDDANNVITSVTLESNDQTQTRVYDAGDFTLGTLTDFDDSDPQVFVSNGGSVPGDVSSVLDNNLDLEEGFINVSSLEFTFSQPVTNHDNQTDFFIVDFGSGQDDSYTITINGTTVGIGPRTSGDTETQSAAIDIDRFSDNTAVSTAAELDALNYAPAGDSSSNLNYQSFDLDNWGIGVGDTINSLLIETTGSGDSDQRFAPAVIAAFSNPIPEPSSLALTSLGLALIAGRRRKPDGHSTRQESA